MRSQPKNTVATIPATGGRMIPRTPATIMRMLNVIDKPDDLFIRMGTGVDVALIAPRKSD